jgi:hypothetical protein
VATLIYSPAIKCHVSTSSGILDLSEDLVSWKLDLRENAVHVFSFKLQNAQRKYDGKILPMDKITVGLKRINWVQGFTGYLNDGPIFQAWPGTLDLTANCTLKIPQFLYWDSQTIESFAMITNALKIGPDGKPPLTSTQGDSGMSQLIVDSLTQVVSWPQDRIHIGQIPPDWYQFAAKVGDLIDRDTQIYQQLGSNYILNGQSSSLRVVLPGGPYANQNWTVAQANNASLIYNTIRYTMNNTDDNIVIMSLMCAMQESSLLNRYSSAVPGSQNFTPNDGPQDPNYDSAGLFQQRAQYYGGALNVMNPVTATQAFVKKLLNVIPKYTAKSRIPQSDFATSSLDFGQMVQAVQISADPGAYSKWQNTATAMVAAANKLAKGSPVANTIQHGGGDLGSSSFKSTGSYVAKTAVDLINAHLNDPIIYSQVNCDPYNTPIGNVHTLDCSSLVDWVYYNASGTPLRAGSRDNVASIYAKVKQIPLDLAKWIQGAVLIHPPNDHIGVSLGDGTTHVAAHDTYPDPHKDVTISPINGNGFTIGGLLPGIDYTNSATTPGAAQQLQQVLGLTKTPSLAPALSSVSDPSQSTDSSGAPNSPFQSLIDGLYFANDNSLLAGSSLGGPVALINDQPFLPWLQNVVNGSMRSFCSAPNGDFIAWFPDYFGIWQSAGIMNIEPIELQEFAVYWSDQQIVTHQFVLGNLGVAAFDSSSGSLGYQAGVQSDLISLAQQTAGVATMDYPEIFQAIYGGTADSSFINTFLQRFGGRPDVQQMPYVQKGKPEFFMALYLFMQRWAAQFSATVPMTFMPELFPGMLLRIPQYGFQAYVQSVTHQGSYGQGGGFTTNVTICAPTTIGDKNQSTTLALLPKSGGGL